MGFRYMKNGKAIEGSLNTEYSHIMVESESDLQTLTTSGECAPGTIAFTAGYKNMWQRSASGEWVDLLEAEE